MMTDVHLKPGTGRPASRPLRASLALTCMLLEPVLAFADESWQTDGLVGYATDYVDRGVSQSDGHGAVRAEVGWQHIGGYGVRLSAATVDFADANDAVAEVNLIAGMEWTRGPIVLATSVALVHFVGAEPSGHYDLVELAGDFVYEVDRWQLDLQAVYSPNESGHVGDALYVAAGIGHRLTDSLAVRAHGGHQWFAHEDDAGASFQDWGIALVWTRGRVSCGLAYSDTDLSSGCAGLCDDRVALTVELAL